MTVAPAPPRSGRDKAPGLFNAGNHYRNSRRRHKAIVCDGQNQTDLIDRGATVLEDYGSFALLSVPDESVAGLEGTAGAGDIRDDMDLILLRAAQFDTADYADSQSQVQLAPVAPKEEGLYLVQMHGPIKGEWLDWLERTGSIITYIPNNAYLVRVAPERFARLRTATAGGPSFIQWVGQYKPGYKISPRIRLDSSDSVTVTVQLIRSSGIDHDLAAIGALSEFTIGEPVSVLNYVDITLGTRASSVVELANMSNVLWIEPAIETRMFDERQDQIV